MNPLLTRRSLVGLAGGSASLLAIGTLPVIAQKKPPAPDTVSVEELMKPGNLPELVIGKADAPVTIVRIRLHDLRPLRRFPQQGPAGS